MKKYLYLVLMLPVGFMACKNKEDKQAETPAEETKTAGGNEYSEAFTASFNNLLTTYYELKDAFVKSDTAAINEAGVALQNLLDSLQLTEVQKKDTIAFSSISGRPADANAEITAMLGEKDLEKKRESFEMVSGVLYDLLRAVRPNGVTAYYQYCPMAFNDKGAYWLSNADSIRNPYFGKKMLTCGEVKETLKY
jgi:Protein of unknown function (DUF3347)